MRQILTVVAINFADLLKLKRSVQQVLVGLANLPSEDREVLMTFYCQTKLGAAIKSQGSNQWIGFNEPQGISTTDWAQLVSHEVENHLLSGNRFRSRDVAGDVGRGCFALHLERT